MPQLAHAQVSVFPLPGIEGTVTHPELPAEVADQGAGFGLADRVDDLFLRELRPLHGSTPFVEDHRICHRTPVLTCRRSWGIRQAKKLAWTACICNLLTVLNTMLKRKAPWRIAASQPA